MMTEIHRTEIDQVAALWTEAPPPLRAGLVFRTGQIDESYATSGSTHLIEHMVLTSLEDPGQRHNGLVGSYTTGFYTVGQPPEVAEFLENVCSRLRSLPGERLDAEKGVLTAEHATRQYDGRAQLLTWRFGAAGYGILGLPQIGFRKAILEDLNQYCSEWFTKENAILWLSGPPPSDLRLDLPSGKKQPVPPLISKQPAFPCWFVDNNAGGVAVGATVTRAYAATFFIEIASRRLRNRLRTEKSISYNPVISYDPLNADTAHLVLFADSDQKHRTELASAFGEVFEELDQYQQSDLELALSQIREIWIGDLAPPPEIRQLGMLQRAAMDWCLGKEFETIEETLEAFDQVTIEDVAAFGREMKSSAIFALTEGVKLEAAFGQKALYSTSPPVKGRWTRNVDSSVQVFLLYYSREGVSLKHPGGSQVTVRFSELAGALLYEDGGLQLTGSDGVILNIEPTLWRDGKRICRKLRNWIPSAKVLDQRSRPPEAIPKPSSSVLLRFLGF